MREYQRLFNLLEITEYPCDYFPCLRTLLLNKDYWKTDYKARFYITHFLWFEIRFAYKSYKRLSDTDKKAMRQYLYKKLLEYINEKPL